MVRRTFLVLAVVALAGTGFAAEDPKDSLQFGTVKLGFDGLVRAEAVDGLDLTDFSFSPRHDDRGLLVRLRPSLQWTPAEYVTGRLEGQWYAFYNHDDFSRTSLYQAYLEGSVPGWRKSVLRAGRQELVYGSTFLLGADTFFDGLTFDAVKLSLQASESLSADVFAGRYVKKNSGGIRGELYGVYGTYGMGGGLLVDLYTLLDTGDEGLRHKDGDEERTFSVGARLTGQLAKGVSFEVEPVYQFGRKLREGPARDRIRAFGGHADLTVEWALGPCPATLFASYAYGSGDGDEDDGTFREFHNPNNDTPLVGDMSVVGDLSGIEAGDAAASGLQVFTLGGGVDVTEALNVSLDAHYFRANRVPGGFSRDLGVEANLILTYRLLENVSVLLSGNRFFTGRFFEDAAGSGKDVLYGYVQLQASL